MRKIEICIKMRATTEIGCSNKVSVWKMSMSVNVNERKYLICSNTMIIQLEKNDTHCLKVLENFNGKVHDAGK